MSFSINRLQKIIKQLEELLPVCNQLNANVSAATVGWHIEHALLTIDVIIQALQKSNPADFKKKFNLIKWIVLTTKTIPRGRAKSPEVVVPKSLSTTESLLSHILKTLENSKVLTSLHHQQFFSHPYFGDIRLQQAIKFLEVHTHHHLKIAKEITVKK